MTKVPDEWSQGVPNPMQAKDWLATHRTDRDPAIAALCNRVIAEANEHPAGPGPRNAGTQQSPFVSDDPPPEE